MNEDEKEVPIMGQICLAVLILVLAVLIAAGMGGMSTATKREQTPEQKKKEAEYRKRVLDN